MTDVPSNLVPTRITQLPEYVGSSQTGFVPYVLDGTTYKVRFSAIASAGEVPPSRLLTAGTGLSGGGDLTADRTFSITAGGVGTDELADFGAGAATYGSAENVPVITVDAKGRISSVADTPIVLTNYVQTTRTITAGAGLSGGGNLSANRTLAVLFSSTAPLALGTATAGTSAVAAREDHVHPMLNLADTAQTTGALPLGRGGTGDALSPVAGGIVYSTGSKFAISDPGIAGQVLTSDGTGEPIWSTASAVAWGDIVGTLSNQTDLQTALNQKADLAGGNTFTGNQFFQNIFPQNLTVQTTGAAAPEVYFSNVDSSKYLGFYWDTGFWYWDSSHPFSVNVDISVPDEAYGAGWNASLEVPTKNAVYDKLESAGWVTNAQLATIATSRLKGRVTASTGNVEDLTGTQVTTLLDEFTSSLKGLAPASGGGTSNFLRADGTWATPPGGGGGGGTTTNPVTFDNAGSGAASGTTFDGSVARTISYNTLGAVPTGALTTSGLTMATSRLLGRTTASTGAVEELTAAAAKTFLSISSSDVSGLGYFATGTDASNLTGTLASAQLPAFTGGDVTSSAGSAVLTIGNGAVSLAKMANVATATVFYRKTAGTGSPEVQTLATLKTDLDLSGTNTGDQTISLTGDVTGSGTGSFAATIANSAVSLAKMANVATATVFYRKTAGTGVPEVQTLATLKADLDLSGTNTGDQTISLTGDVTGSGTGSFAATIANNSVTNAKLATVATATFKGRVAASTGNVEDLSGTQATTLLDEFTSALKGLAPASGGGTANFLRADGTWAAPPGGSGTVTSVSVVTANGVSGSVATATTTPAITLTLGAITPTSVAATGTVTGSNLSGTNTGDQTITLTGDVTGSGTGSFATSIAANAVVDADIRQSAALSVIGRSANSTGNVADISAASDGQVLRRSGTTLAFGAVDLAGANAVTGTLAAGNGGTGVASYAVGDILYASASTTLAKLAGVATGNALISGGVATAPSWGKIGLTTHISGTLAVGNGGTGATTLTGLVVGNGTSAFTTVTAPSGTVVGTSDTQTLTNKRLEPRVSSTTSITTPLAWNSDNFDQYAATAQSTAFTISADAGTPVNGQKAIFRFKDNGTSRTITFTGGASKAFRPVGVTLTVSGSNWTYATTASKTVYFGCIYNSADSRWDIIALSAEA